MLSLGVETCGLSMATYTCILNPLIKSNQPNIVPPFLPHFVNAESGVDSWLYSPLCEILVGGAKGERVDNLRPVYPTT